MASRSEIAAQLEAFADGRIGPAALAGWAEQQESPHTRFPTEARDTAVDDALADLSLLGVHLLTPDDVPALHALLDPDDPQRAVQNWRRYREAIDLDARSKQLRRDPFYRPFCR